MAQLVSEAQRLGVPPEDFAKILVEDGLDLRREAEASSFAQIMRPVRKAAGTVREAEIIDLVKRARNDRHSGAKRLPKR